MLNDAEMGHLARCFPALSSYEQFWDQSNWALAMDRGTEWQREWKEKVQRQIFSFRPTLSC